MLGEISQEEKRRNFKEVVQVKKVDTPNQSDVGQNLNHDRKMLRENTLKEKYDQLVQGQHYLERERQIQEMKLKQQQLQQKYKPALPIVSLNVSKSPKSNLFVENTLGAWDGPSRDGNDILEF